MSRFSLSITQLSLGILLFISLCVRLYQLPSTYLFQGDQGRDALVIYSLVAEKQPILLGPTTSLGNYYLGPFFYYLMAPSLLVAGLNPVGPALFQALLGVLTVALGFLFAHRVLSQRSSLIVGLLLALSPTLISYSRFSWNPNPTPLFSLLFIWALHTFLVTKKNQWFIASVILATLLWQLHYVLLVFGLALLPITVIWHQQKYSLKKYVLSLVIIMPFLALSLLPLAASWYKNILHATGSSSSILSINTTTPLTLVRTYWELFTTIMPNSWPLTSSLMLILTTISMALVLKAAVTKATTLVSESEPLWWSSLTVVVLAMVVGLSLLGSDREIHYFLGFYPLIFLLFGKGLDWLNQRFTPVQQVAVSGGFVALFLIQALLVLPALFQPTGLPASTVQAITQDIQTLSGNQPFNFALIAETNERKTYEYFFTVDQVKNHSAAVSHQLFIVCENEPCQINGHPDWQIAQFEATYVNAVRYEEVALPSVTGEYPKLFQGVVKSR